MGFRPGGNGACAQSISGMTLTSGDWNLTFRRVRGALRAATPRCPCRRVSCLVGLEGADLVRQSRGARSGPVARQGVRSGRPRPDHVGRLSGRHRNFDGRHAAVRGQRPARPRSRSPKRGRHPAAATGASAAIRHTRRGPRLLARFTTISRKPFMKVNAYAAPSASQPLPLATVERHRRAPPSSAEPSAPTTFSCSLGSPASVTPTEAACQRNAPRRTSAPAPMLGSCPASNFTPTCQPRPTGASS